MTVGGGGGGGSWGLVAEGFGVAVLGRKEEALTLSFDLEEARSVGLGGGGDGSGGGRALGSRGGVAET